MDFTHFGKNLNRVIGSFDVIVLDTAMEFKDSIADLNVSQLVEGKTYKGKNITPKYEFKEYAEGKKKMGAKPPKFTPDLKLEGDFHSGIYAKKRKDFIYTWSTDEKSESLNSKYRHIFGLMKANQAKLNKDIQPKLSKRLKNELLTS